jgi:hypothetical protein
MSNLIKHAIKELELIRENNNDPIQISIEKDILEIIDTFSKQHHSGTTANYVINIINKLLQFKPLSPLTGEDWEWTEVSEGIFQKKRDSTVFKQKDRFNGNPYTIEGKIFTNDNGISFFTSSDSFQEITFPYSPKKPEIIYLKGEHNDTTI